MNVYSAHILFKLIKNIQIFSIYLSLDLSCKCKWEIESLA